MNTVNLLASQMSIGRARMISEALQTGPARDELGQVTLPIETRTDLR